MLSLSPVRELRSRSAETRRASPEWWLVAIAIGCWLWLLVSGLSRSPLETIARGVSSSHAHGSSFGMAMVSWMLMCGAMMSPLAVPAFRHVAFSSFRFRQLRSGLIFAGAFGLVWMVFGLMVILALRATGISAEPRRATLACAVALVTAAVWQLAPAKRRALNACHLAIPLQAFGRRADRSCAHFGLLQGWRCLGSCWALMFVMALAGGLLWMIGFSLLMLLERPPRWRIQTRQPSAIALGLLAFLVLVQQLV